MILSALFQLNVAPDDLNNVDAREQILNEALRNHFRESVRIAGANARRRSARYAKKIKPAAA